MTAATATATTFTTLARTVVAGILVAGVGLGVAPSRADAQTEATTIARLTSRASCRQIVVDVYKKVIGSSALVSVTYVVSRCEPGSTEPTQVVVQGGTALPSGAWQERQNTYSLVATTPDGVLSLTWTLTNRFQTTSDYTQVFRENGVVVRRVQETQSYVSAQVTGSALSWPVPADGQTASVTQLTKTQR